MTAGSSGETGHVVIVASDGMIHVICFDSQGDAQPSKVVAAWKTGTPHPTCVAWNDALRLLTIGYRSGKLEEWRLSPCERNNAEGTSQEPSSSKAVGKDDTGTAILLDAKRIWQGAFHNFPVSSVVSSLGSPLSSLAGDHLAVCIVQHQTPVLGRSSHASTVHVLSRTALREGYESLQKNAGHGNANPSMLELFDYNVWPDESLGMEPLDASSLQQALGTRSRPPTTHPSFGTNLLVASKNNNNDDDDDNNNNDSRTPVVAAALSDGSVSIIHSRSRNDDEQQRGLAWGVWHDANQVVLSFPAIGLGLIEIDDETRVVCCLRGGTIYALPIVSPPPVDENNDVEAAEPLPAVSVYLPPEEEEDHSDVQNDPSLRYVHGFACGNIQFDKNDNVDDRRDVTSLPIVVYCGPCGTMDVYACSLHTFWDEELSTGLLLKELNDDGTIQMLLDIHRNHNHHKDDNTLLDGLWQESKRECQNKDVSPDTILANQDNAFSRTIALLLQLSRI